MAASWCEDDTIVDLSLTAIRDLDDVLPDEEEETDV